MATRTSGQPMKFGASSGASPSALITWISPESAPAMTLGAAGVGAGEGVVDLLGVRHDRADDNAPALESTRVDFRLRSM